MILRWTFLPLAALLAAWSVYPVGHVTAAVTDQYGNHVADNGSISWVSIPVGNKTYNTENYYDDGGLGLLFAFARGFINTVQPNSFPFEVLKKALNGTFDIGDDYMELVDYSMGFAICFAIGLLFVVLLPLCGCCICCCRCCCGNCGGDMKAVYNKNEDCKRMGMAQALFMMAVLMAGSAGCVWMTNGRFTVALDYTQSTLDSNLDDLPVFFDNLIEQFQYVAIDMYSLVQQAIIDDIGALGVVIEDAIFKNLGITDVVNSVIELDTAIHNISDALAQVIADKDTLVAASNNLTTAMNTLGNDIDSTKTTCSSSGVACQTACTNIDTAPLKTGGADFSSLPDLSTVQSSVDSVKAMNLSGIANSANAAIDDMSNLVANSTGSIQITVNNTMNGFADMVKNMSNDVTQQFNNTVDVSGLKKDLSGFFEMLKNYDGYRVYFGWGLTGLFTVVVAMILLGLFCGCLGQDSDKLPTERGCMSNCGGCLLIIPVIMMFAVGSLLMLLTTLTFAVGGSMEKICQPLIDLTMFSDFIDKGAINGMSLGQMIHNNESSHITIYNLLLGCRANKAPFKLMGLDELLDLDQYLNHTQYTGTLKTDMASMTSIDLSSYSILTPDMKTALTDFSNSGLDGINFTAINSSLSQTPTGVDLSALITAMEAVRDSCSGATRTAWDTHITDTKTIQDHRLPAVTTAQSNLIASMGVLEGQISGLSAKINNTLATAEAADNQLQNNVTAVMTEAIEDFVDRVIAYVEQFANQTLDLVYNEVARCLPVWNIYDSIVSIICRYMVESLNAFWFSTGWGLLFFIPVMVMSMKLSKYYRKMKDQEGYKEDVDVPDEDIDDFAVRYDMVQRHNKVAPDPDFMD